MIIILLSLAWSLWEVYRKEQNVYFVDEMRKVAFERTVLRDDYIIHHEERAKIQWLAKSEHLRTLFQSALDRFPGKEDKALLQKARGNFDATFSIFSEVLELRSSKKDFGRKELVFDERESRLISQVFLRAYTLNDDVTKLREFAGREATQARSRGVWIIVLLVMGVVLAVTVNTAVVNRILARRVAGLARGVGIIGDGNLEYRIDVEGDDELSDLAGASNEMAAKLKESLTSIDNLNGEIAERRRAEEELRVSLAFLEAVHNNREIVPLLKEFVSKIKDYTGCDAVGIRVLSENGEIPYRAYEGFSREFYELENPLSVGVDQCMCINVIRGSIDPVLPFYTKDGSFFMNGTTRFLATVSEEDKGRTRNVCNKEGYESVALVPFRKGNRILGLIHVADRRDNMVPLKVVEILEKAALQLGTALERVQAEDQVLRLNAELEQRVAQRTAQLEAANKELESFAYSVSHDLRAPLRGIDGWSLALLEDYGDRLDDQARKYLHRVRAETQQMGRLIDDMLKLSRVTRAEIQLMPIDLTAMAHSIAVRLQEEKPDRRIEFIIQPALKANGDSSTA